MKLAVSNFNKTSTRFKIEEPGRSSYITSGMIYSYESAGKLYDVVVYSNFMKCMINQKPSTRTLIHEAIIGHYGLGRSNPDKSTKYWTLWLGTDWPHYILSSADGGRGYAWLSASNTAIKFNTKPELVQFCRRNLTSGIFDFRMKLWAKYGKQGSKAVYRVKI